MIKPISIVLVLSACNGGGSNAGNDAAIDATAIDATSVDASPSVVDVHALTLTGDGLPAVGSSAIFYDATETPVAIEPIDATGHARHALPGGGMVAVIDPAQSPVRIVFVRDVHDGDTITTGNPRDPLHNSTGPYDTMFVEYPATTGQVQAAHYCGDSGPSGTNRLTLTFYDECVTPTFDLYLRDNNNSTYIWEPNVAFVPGTTHTVTGPWRAWESGAASYTNLPTGLSSGFFDLRMVITGDEAGGNYGFRQIAVDQPSATMMSWTFPNTGRSASPTAKLSRAGYLSETFTIIDPTLALDHAFDFAAQPLPVIVGKATQTATGASWMQTGSGTPDARQLLWIGSWSGSAGPRQATIHVIEPHSASTTISIPALPSQFADDDVTRVPAVAVQLKGAYVTLVDFSHTDYAGARQLGDRLARDEWTFLDVPHTTHTTQSRGLF